MVISQLQQHTDIQASFDSIRKLGQSYFVLVGCVFAAFGAVVVISDFAQQHLPSIVTPILTALAFSFLSISLFSLLAYVAKQNTLQMKKLKNRPIRRPLASKVPSIFDAQDERLDANIDIAMKNGEYDQAIALLEQEVQRNNFLDVRRDQLYSLLIARNDAILIERYSELFLWLLVGRNRIIEASNLLLKIIAQNKGYQINDLKLCHKLASCFLKKKEYDLVIWSAEDAHSRFDSSSELAELYFMASTAHLEKNNNKKSAHRLLRYIAKYFEHEAIGQKAEAMIERIYKKQIIFAKKSTSHR